MPISMPGALAELLDVEGVSVAEVVRWCPGELDRVEIDRLKCLTYSQAAKSPR